MRLLRDDHSVLQGSWFVDELCVSLANSALLVPSEVELEDSGDEMAYEEVPVEPEDDEEEESEITPATLKLTKTAEQGQSESAYSLLA